jgi:hypothetical protein
LGPLPPWQKVFGVATDKRNQFGLLRIVPFDGNFCLLKGSGRSEGIVLGSIGFEC